MEMTCSVSNVTEITAQDISRMSDPVKKTAHSPKIVPSQSEKMKMTFAGLSENECAQGDKSVTNIPDRLKESFTCPDSDKSMKLRFDECSNADSTSSKLKSSIQINQVVGKLELVSEKASGEQDLQDSFLFEQTCAFDPNKSNKYFDDEDPIDNTFHFPRTIHFQSENMDVTCAGILKQSFSCPDSDKSVKLHLDKSLNAVSTNSKLKSPFQSNQNVDKLELPSEKASGEQDLGCLFLFEQTCASDVNKIKNYSDDQNTDLNSIAASNVAKDVFTEKCTDLPECHLVSSKVSPNVDTEMHKENLKHTLDSKDLSDYCILPEQSYIRNECEEHSPPKRFKADEITVNRDFQSETSQQSSGNSILYSFDIQDSDFLPNVTFLTVSQKKIFNVNNCSKVDSVKTHEKVYDIQENSIRKENLTPFSETIDKKIEVLPSDNGESPYFAIPSISQDSNFLQTVTLLNDFSSQEKNRDSANNTSKKDTIKTEQKALDQNQENSIRKEFLIASCEMVDKKLEYLPSDIKSPLPAVPPVNENKTNVQEQRKIKELSSQQNCKVDGYSACTNQSVEERNKNNCVQSTVELKVRDSSFSDSYKYINENNCSEIIQQQLKRSHPSTPGVVFNIRKMKKIKFNYKPTKEVNNCISEVFPEVAKQLDFKTLSQLKTVPQETTTNSTLLPSVSSNYDSSSKPTVTNISITSSFSFMPSTVQQYISPIKHKEATSFMKAAEDGSTNISFEGKELNCCKVIEDKLNTSFNLREFNQHETTEVSTNTSFSGKELNPHQTTEISTNTSFSRKELNLHQTAEISTNTSFGGKEWNQHKTTETSTNTSFSVKELSQYKTTETSTNTSFKGKELNPCETKDRSTSPIMEGEGFDDYKVTEDKSTSISFVEKDIHQCKTTETSTNTSFEEKELVQHNTVNTSFDGKELNKCKTTEISVTTLFKGKELNQYKTIEKESTNSSFEGKELNQCKTSEDKSENALVDEKDLNDYIANKSMCNTILDVAKKELPTLVTRDQSMSVGGPCVEITVEDECKTVSDLISDMKNPKIDLKERDSLITTAETYPVTPHTSETLLDKTSNFNFNMKDAEITLKERGSFISTAETCPVTSLPSGTLLDKNSNPSIETNLCEETENKMSLSENDDLSLDEFKESLNLTLSGEESRITLKTIDNSRAVLKLQWGPWIYKCGLVLHITQDKPDQTSILFEQEKFEDDWLVNLGYKAFYHLVKEKVIYNPFCSKKTILKLSEYSAIAYKVEILMQDLFKVSVSFAFSISDNMDDLEINLNMINDDRQSSYRLICPIDLNSYPSKNIVPRLKHQYLNDITEEVKNAVSLVEPGRSYIWNIGKAASRV